MDLFIQYGIAAGIRAIEDSGIEVTEANATRIGAAIGSGIGGLGLIEENCSSLAAGGPRKVSPFFVPSTIINMVAGHLSIMYGLRDQAFPLPLPVHPACITLVMLPGSSLTVMRM